MGATASCRSRIDFQFCQGQAAFEFNADNTTCLSSGNSFPLAILGPGGITVTSRQEVNAGSFHLDEQTEVKN